MEDQATDRRPHNPASININTTTTAICNCSGIDSGRQRVIKQRIKRRTDRTSHCELFLPLHVQIHCNFYSLTFDKGNNSRLVVQFVDWLIRGWSVDPLVGRCIVQFVERY